MKTISMLLITALFSSCSNSNQNKAVEQAKEIQSAIRPGSIASTSSGYNMKAKIDGKDWEAVSMAQPDVAGRIVGYYNSEYIGLPYSRTEMVAGKKIIISEDNAIDLSLKNGCLYTNPKGQIEITKVDGSWAEGKFFFTTTCSSTNKAVEVTEGFFKIPFAKK